MKPDPFGGSQVRDPTHSLARDGTRIDLERQFIEAHAHMQQAKSIVVASGLHRDPDEIATGTLTHKYLDHSRTFVPHYLYAPKKMRPMFALDMFLPLKRFRTRLPAEKPTCAVICDYGSFAATGLKPDMFGKSCFWIGFDHHPGGPADDFPKNGMQVVDPEAASTTVLMYRFLRFLGIPITKAMATFVAVGIYADQRNILNAGAEAFHILAHCEEMGIPSKTMQAVMRSITLQESLALSAIIPKVYETFDEKHGIARAIISKENPLTSALTWGTGIKAILDWLELLDDARVALLFTELTPGVWKIHLRSKPKHGISMDRLARALEQYGAKNAGGHLVQAAAIWNDTPEKATEIIRQAIK